MALVDSIRNSFSQGTGTADEALQKQQQGLANLKRFKELSDRGPLGGSALYERSKDFYNEYKTLASNPEIHKNQGEWEAGISAAQRGSDDAKKAQETYSAAAKPFEDLYGQQSERAQKFRMQFPSILNNQLAGERVNMRRNIASGVGDARKGYNSRGLLYGGLRTGAEAGVGADAGAKYAATVADKTKALNDQANSLDQDVTETGKVLGDIGNEVSGNTNASRQALLDSLMQQSQAKDEAIGGLLGGVGKLGGTIAGNLAKKDVK